MSREKFRANCFVRDRGKCVVPNCNKPAEEVHHIIERRLWTEPEEEGGYVEENGASVCNYHHQLCERNIIAPQVLRYWLGLPTVLPKGFDVESDFNKWGEPFKKPTREEAKYPSTPYFNFSPSSKDSFFVNVEDLLGYPLVITTKMDGSNVVLRNSGVAARNGNDAIHPSFALLKKLHAENLQWKIPSDIQIFGEWLYAKHSIHYKGQLSLKSYLQIFAIYHIPSKLWLGWDQVEQWAKTLGVITTPVQGYFTFNKEWELTQAINWLARQVISEGHEGIVVKTSLPMYYSQHEQLSAKYVRANHVQTDEHWKNQPLVKNELC